MAASTNSKKNNSKAAKAPLYSIKSSSEKGTDFDRLIHERTRLAIVSALAANKSLHLMI